MDSQSSKQNEHIYKEDANIGKVREWFNEGSDQFLHTGYDIDCF